MWFINDGCGIICCLITYTVMLTVSGLVTKVSISQLSNQGFMSFWGGLSGYFITLGLAITSHLQCIFTDPGALPLNFTALQDTLETKNSQNYCRRCSSYKPPKTHHCKYCGRCIQRMDHHCPWINNCVGQNTQKPFILFLFYTGLGCVYSFILLAIRAGYCIGNSSVLCSRPKQDAAFDLLLGMVALFLGAIFALFVTVMLYDQFYCIVNNTTGIDILKETRVEDRPVRASLEEVFGGGFGLKWFCPIPVRVGQYSGLAEF